jgi:hypothetical protein
MPAVTANTLTLARVTAARPDETERPVQLITTGPQGYEGEGFPVVREFAGSAPERWTRSYTWTRWVRWNTCPASQGAPTGLSTWVTRTVET